LSGSCPGRWSGWRSHRVGQFSIAAAPQVQTHCARHACQTWCARRYSHDPRQARLGLRARLEPLPRHGQGLSLDALHRRHAPERPWCAPVVTERADKGGPPGPPMICIDASQCCVADLVPLPGVAQRILQSYAPVHRAHPCPAYTCGRAAHSCWTAGQDWGGIGRRSEVSHGFATWPHCPEEATNISSLRLQASRVWAAAGHGPARRSKAIGVHADFGAPHRQSSADRRVPRWTTCLGG
jgi:hypothetical protein